MRVSVELPDPPRLEPLLSSLSQQYAEVMRHLMGLTREMQRTDRLQPMVSALAQQQDALVAAFERLMGLMQQGRQEDQGRMQEVIRQEVAAPQQAASGAMLSAIRGIRRSLTQLPESLDTTMSKHFKHRQRELLKAPEPPMTRTPDTSIRIVQKLDQMEAALVQGLKGSRNRTFGSNY